MNNKKVILIFISLLAGLSIYYAFFSNTDEGNYRQQIIKERKDRDQYMRTASDSPFSKNEKDFTGLKYFEPDPNFRFMADLEYTKKEPRQIKTSDGQVRNYLTYAYAAFDIGNLRQQLLILEVMDSGPQRGTLFLAFTDQTSTSETYGAGRYLDLKKVPGSTTIVLDFNLAYNPFCAYDDQFSCPLPPQENNLQVAIRAGELNYH